MTKDEIKEGIKENRKQYEKQQGKPSNPIDELNNIAQIKAGDLIAVTVGRSSVKEFAIATSDYYFAPDKNANEDNAHRVDVEYLGFGTDKIYSDSPKGIFRDASNKILDYLGKQEKYFIITQNPDSGYDDVEGEQYQYDNHKPNFRRFVEGSNFIVQSKINEVNQFVGYGKVGTIVQSKDTTKEGKSITKFVAKYSDYTPFQEPKIRTDEIHQRMKDQKSYGGRAPAILPIDQSLYAEIIGEDLIENVQLLDTLNLGKFTEVLEWIPNLILYGPPGTGKTYHAKEIAKDLTSSNKSNRSFEHILTGTLQQPADIHQMSDDEYRDFVIDSIKNEAEEQDYTFTEINTYGQYSLEKDGQKIHIDIHYSASTTRDPDDLYVGISQTNIDFLKQVPEDNRFIIIVNHSRKNFVVLPYSIEQKQKAEFSNSTDGNWDPTGVNAHSFHIIIDADKVNFKRAGYDCKKFMRNINMIFSNETIMAVTFHPSFSYEDFIEGFRPDVNPSTSSQYVLEDGIFKTACNIAKTDRDKKIVIIIDEINRGNIPKIFGELISLIENDKRGPNNSLKLVYSKENFFVPKNLYIIGTMNTADKSLVQMDEALRRRFAFEELMPDAALLDDRPARKYKEILVLLNKRIVNTKERMKQYRDKQIGHSYFWNMEDDEDLRLVIKYQIIPLLQDYFYDDYEEIKTILGNEIIGPDNRPSYLLDQGNETKLKDAMLDALKDKAPKETESEEEQIDDNE